MALYDWSWDGTVGPADRSLLEALAAAIPRPGRLDRGLDRRIRDLRQRLRRCLPTHLVVALVVAIGL